MIAIPYEPWMASARCLDAEPDTFFPEKGGSTREAKAICADCPVRDDCLEYAMANDERFGIWGGMAERERRRLKRRGGHVVVPLWPDLDTETERRSA